MAHKLKGQKINKLLVLETCQINSNTRGLLRGWKCQCECGEITYLLTEHLTRKTKPVQTCGKCPKYKPESLFNKAFAIYKRNARDRNIEFNLSKEETRLLFSQNCFYCGNLPSNTIRTKNQKREFNYQGIDRQDNNKGYDIENVVPCCIKCNFRKGTSSHEEFMNWIRSIIRNHSI